jgi:hypothetical protein
LDYLTPKQLLIVQALNTYVKPHFLNDEGFDIIYDNATKTLDDSKIWGKRLIENCFRWRDSIGGATDPEIYLANF